MQNLIQSQVQRSICWAYYLFSFFNTFSLLLFPNFSTQTEIQLFPSDKSCSSRRQQPVLCLHRLFSPCHQHLPDLLTTKQRGCEEKVTKRYYPVPNPGVLSHSGSGLSSPVTFYLLFLLHGAFWQDSTSHMDTICKLQMGLGGGTQVPCIHALALGATPCAYCKRHPFLWQTLPWVWVPAWQETSELEFNSHSPS